MDFEFTPEQVMLRDTLAGFLADRYDFETRRAVACSGAGWRPEVWRAFASELDLLGAAFPESLGGQGGGAIENGVVMEELGKALVLEPYLGTVVIGGGLLKHAGGALAREFVPRIVSGEAILALACAERAVGYDFARHGASATRSGDGYVLDGHKVVVAGAAWSTQLVVTARDGAGLSVFLVDRDAKGVTLRDYPTIDGGRAADVGFERVGVPARRVIGVPGGGQALVEQVLDEAICALCAEAVGAMGRMHAATVDYLSQRRQFGVPLASFQVLQHRVADMFVALEQSIALTQVATLKLDTPERARAASAAKAQIGTAGKFIGQAAIQLHGGMGITEELALGHYFRRLTAIGAELGTTDEHLRRYADLALGEDA